MNTEVNLTRKLWASFRGYTGCCKTFTTPHNKIFLFEIYKKNYIIDNYKIDEELDTNTIVKELEKAVHKIKMRETASQLDKIIDNLKEKVNKTEEPHA